MEKASCRLLFFAKHPVAGKVKTRLATEVGENAAVELYKRFIMDMLNVFDALDLKVDIFIDPPDACERFEIWLNGVYHFYGQTGCNLGERMKNAFSQTFDSETEKAILVGSDVPALEAGNITKAFEALDKCDTVIGPAYDGGYYLIGFNKSAFLPEVFDHIEWSTDKVFAQSIEILRVHDRKIHLMGELGDIDTVEDMVRFVRRYEGCDKDSATISYIMEKKLVSAVDISTGDKANE